MEFLNEFGVDPILLLAQVVNFTILLVLLRVLLYKPILKVLEERKKKVAKSIKDAEAIEKRLTQTQIEQEELLSKAAQEASKIVNQAKLEAKELAEKTMEEAKKSVNEMLVKNETRLKLERDEMMSSVKAELADLVTQAAAKVLDKSVNEFDNKKLVQETIEEMKTK